MRLMADWAECSCSLKAVSKISLYKI